MRGLMLFLVPTDKGGEKMNERLLHRVALNSAFNSGVLHYVESKDRDAAIEYGLTILDEFYRGEAAPSLAEARTALRGLLEKKLK